MRRAARLAVLLFAALLLQNAVLADFRLADVRPDVLLLVAVVAGMVGGSEQGAFIGFLAGLVADLFAQTPLGLSALAFSVVGFGTGALQSTVVRATWWIGPLTATVASAAGVALFGLAGAVVGQSYLVRPHLAVVAALVAIMNAFLEPLMARMARWAVAPPAATERVYAR